MLFEKIEYSDSFPINIKIGNMLEDPVHYHQDIEFVFVLNGEVLLRSGYCSYTLKAGDIFTNCGHEIHNLASNGKDNIVALIQPSTYFFSQYFPTLSKSCYRTYTRKGMASKHDRLKELLLEILLHSLSRDFDYRNQCINLMIDVIGHVEKYFNLFAFDEDIVVNFEGDNPVTIERISRIISYIYQHYSEKISLKELAGMEYLSEFYISHIIKNCTGMSFREFLCFARVEASEIPLLDTNKKISQIAREVGFSTTAYYEKYFYRWFKCTPEEHRERYQPLVKSNTCRERLESISSGKLVSLINGMMTTLNAQRTNTSVVNSTRMEISVDIHGIPQAAVEPRLEVLVCCEDMDVLGCRLTGLIADLRPDSVILLTVRENTPEQVSRLRTLLKQAGFDVGIREADRRTIIRSYGNDSVIHGILALERLLHARKSCTVVQLRDVVWRLEATGGVSGLLTTTGVKKIAYFIYQILSLIKGDILCQGKNYCVIRLKTEKDVYAVLAYNFNDELLRICIDGSTPHYVQNVLSAFKDEIYFEIHLNLPAAIYQVVKYTIVQKRDVFSYTAALGFTKSLGILDKYPDIVPTEPDLDVSMEDVKTSLDLAFSIRGAGIQLAFIEKIGETCDE